MLADLYQRYLGLTGDAVAAATLVLAHVQSKAQPEIVSVPHAAEILGVSKDTVFRMCRNGQLRHRRIGSRIKIERESLKGEQRVAGALSRHI